MSFKRICTVVLLTTCFVAYNANAQDGVQERHKNDQATFQLLEQYAITVDFAETSFGDVMDFLHAQTGLTYRLHESTSDNNLDQETLINCQLEQTRIATVLDFILKEYQCTWCVVDGVVEFHSEDSSWDQENHNVMVFNCSELLARIRPKTVRHRAHNRGGSQGGGFGGGGGVFSVADGQQEEAMVPPIETPSQDPEPAAGPAEPTTPPAPQFVETTYQPIDQLTDLIMETVDPESWEQAGGTGRMVTLNNVIVVRQTTRNLRQIDTLLDQLAAAGLED